VPVAFSLAMAGSMHSGAVCEIKVIQFSGDNLRAGICADFEDSH
jgi:hypothetical protein